MSVFEPFEHGVWFYIAREPGRRPPPAPASDQRARSPAASARRARACSRSPARAMPPSMCTASRNTRTVSASLTSGLAVQRRKPSSRASPCDGEPQRQEMQRQEARQRQAGEPVHHGCDPQRVAAVAGGVELPRAHDSTTAATARSPSAASTSPKPHIENVEGPLALQRRPLRRRSRARRWRRAPPPPARTGRRTAPQPTLPRVRPRISAALKPAARRVEDDGQMRQHQRRHDRRRRPLQDVEADVHGVHLIIPDAASPSCGEGLGVRNRSERRGPRLPVPPATRREDDGDGARPSHHHSSPLI